MRGADDATRHTAEPVASGSRARTHRARALTGDVTKSAAESAEALPTRLERDIRDRLVSVAQQRRGPLDAPREQVSVRRYTEGLLE